MGTFETVPIHLATPPETYPPIFSTAGQLKVGAAGLVGAIAGAMGGAAWVASQRFHSSMEAGVTRIAADAASRLAASLPNVEVNQLARTAFVRGESPAPRGTGTVAVVTAGTSDLPVAEEAAVTLDALGDCVMRVTDVGVAGIHRVLAKHRELASAAVVIVVAGMDGALPSVVGGMVAAPVIAVPTSVGYGASFGGIAALLTMLNSCAAGVTVVNIDNGFGAAVAASRITHAE